MAEKITLVQLTRKEMGGVKKEDDLQFKGGGTPCRCICDVGGFWMEYYTYQSAAIDP